MPRATRTAAVPTQAQTSIPQEHEYPEPGIPSTTVYSQPPRKRRRVSSPDEPVHLGPDHLEPSIIDPVSAPDAIDDPGHANQFESLGDLISQTIQDGDPLEPPTKRQRQTTGERGKRGGRGGKAGGGGRAAMMKLAKEWLRSPSPEGEKTPKKRGRAKGVKTGPRKAIFDDIFREIQGEATEAFIRRDYELAEEKVKEAIQYNPEVFSAYSLLSEIHLGQGDEQKAIDVLFIGAHTNHRDSNLWMDLAETILQRFESNRQMALESALYCYTHVVSINDENLVNARYEAGLLRLELGDPRAADDFRICLKRQPYDVQILRLLIEGLNLNGKYTDGIDLYDDFRQHFADNESTKANELDWSDVNLYADLFLFAQQPVEGCRSVKQFCRWLQGRRVEEFWDQELKDASGNTVDDDREFDDGDDPRRLALPDFIPGQFCNEAYGDIPLEIRVKLGLFRLKQGPKYREEALHHFSWLHAGSHSVFEYADLFRDVADSLRELGAFTDALEYYTPVIDCIEEPDLYRSVAFCYRQTKHYTEADEFYHKALAFDPQDATTLRDLALMWSEAGDLQKAGPYLAQANTSARRWKRARKNKSNAERVLASIEQDETVLDTIENHEEVDEEEEDEEEESETEALLTGRPKPRNKAKRNMRDRQTNNVEEIEEDVRSLFLVIRAAELARTNNEPGSRKLWMDAAESALSFFRSRRVFYSYDRSYPFLGYDKEAKLAVVRLRGKGDILTAAINEGIVPPDEFGTVKFEAWLDVFLEYALHLAEDGNALAAYQTMNDAYDANVFYHNKEYVERIHLVWLCCALKLNDSNTISTVSRYFVKNGPTGPAPFQLMAIFHRACSLPNASFGSGPMQKYIARTLKSLNEHEKDEMTAEARREYESRKVAILVLYGEFLYTNGSFMDAVDPFQQALKYEPEHPKIIFLLALCYLQYAMRRQAPDRQMLILQGMTHLWKYHEIQTTSGQPMMVQEAVYNVGRAYHMLGLPTTAIPHYEHALELAEKEPILREGKHKTITNQAALALQQIWAMGGDTKKALEITKKWLRI